MSAGRKLALSRPHKVEYGVMKMPEDTMRIGILALLGLAALVGGCTTMTPEERRAADETQCRSYGFTKRNDAFAECLQRIDLDRRAERRANDIAFNRYDPWIGRPYIVYARPPRKK
jgi:hypothetical protein